MRDENLAARLRRIEDREEIRTLVARYCRHVDDHNFPALAALWAPEARYSWKDSPDVTIGGEDVASLLKSRIEPTGPSFHITHDHVIEFGDDEDRASGLVSAHAETSGPSGQNIGAIRYHDEYVRHDGHWKFAERQLAFLYFTPVSDYHEIMKAKHRMRLPDGTSLPAHWPDFAR